MQMEARNFSNSRNPFIQVDGWGLRPRKFPMSSSSANSADFISPLVCSHVSVPADPECNGSATALAVKGFNVVRLPIPSGWEDASVIMTNHSPDISVLAQFLPAPTAVASFRNCRNVVVITLHLGARGRLAHGLVLVNADRAFVERDPAVVVESPWLVSALLIHNLRARVAPCQRRSPGI